MFVGDIDAAPTLSIICNLCFKNVLWKKYSVNSVYSVKYCWSQKFDI